ncbi:unnamed protein product [Candidula unifasciata]|uniref:Cytochrome P450 n=1 Tax=Candidula unifasciata TaxID=100452 RepID=A0A8S3ZDN2_9EUPU|nr:unnamed protein product [Candidula unifasciata]
MAVVTVLLAVLMVALTYAYFKLFYRKRKPGEPPIVPGHFLWGNGQQFMEHAVQFLSKSRQKYGDVFTIRLLNQHWTMVLDVHSFELFAKEKNFDFKEIEEQVNQNVFGYQLFESRKMINEAGQKVNGKYLFVTVENFAKNLSEAFKLTSKQTQSSSGEKDITVLNQKNTEMKIDESGKQEVHHSGECGSIADSELFIDSGLNQQPGLPTGGVGPAAGVWCQDELRNFTSKIFFSPVFYTIFGRGDSGKSGSFQPQVFHKNFDLFHKYFNFLWIGLPIKLFPKAMEAVGVLAQQPSSAEMVNRDGCSDYIKHSTQFMLKNKQSERDIICHNLIFLHVNYNTFRVAYWCLYKLMEDDVVMAAVKKEVEDVVEAKRTGANEAEYEAEFTADDINKLPIIDSFLKETIRVTSGVFMVRVCTADTRFSTADGRTFNIRKGDKVAMYPPVFHHDPEVFQDPETFKYDRFVDAEFFKNGIKVKHPMTGFGSLCFGQKLSMLQLKWFIINVVNSFKMELLNGERTLPNKTMYGHEILPPTHDVRCRFIPRERACTLKFLNNYGSTGSRGDGTTSSNVL